MSNPTLIPQESLKQLSGLINSSEKISAVLVVKSKSTGQDFTYKINTSESEKYGRSIFIKYESSYNTFIGCARAYQGRAQLFQKHQGTKSPVMLGAKFILDKLLTKNISNITQVAEVHHTGNCIKCNRELTDIESIELGIGPVCRKKQV